MRAGLLPTTHAFPTGVRAFIPRHSPCGSARTRSDAAGSRLMQRALKPRRLDIMGRRATVPSESATEFRDQGSTPRPPPGHAGGRGFESRRSRLRSPWKWTRLCWLSKRAFVRTAHSAAELDVGSFPGNVPDRSPGSFLQSWSCLPLDGVAAEELGHPACDRLWALYLHEVAGVLHDQLLDVR